MKTHKMVQQLFCINPWLQTGLLRVRMREMARCKSTVSEYNLIWACRGVGLSTAVYAYTLTEMATPADSDAASEPTVANGTGETGLVIPEELKCTLCEKELHDPKVLPCCHTYCKACLEGLLASSSDRRKLTCPQALCGATHKVPEAGVGDFLTDYTTLHDLEMFRATKAKDLASCEGCDTSDPPVAYCTDCRAFLCDFCSTAHMRMKLCRNHRVIPKENLGQEPLERRKEMFCIWHATCGEPMRVYCKTCQIPVCCHCIVASHQAHILVNIDQNTRKEVQSKMTSLAETVHQRLARYEESQMFIGQVEKRANSRPNEIKTAINATFDRLAAALESRRARLLEEADMRCTTDLMELNLQKELVNSTLSALKGVTRFSERTFQCESDIEFLTMSAQTTTQLEKLEKMNWDPSSIAKVECTTWRFNPCGDHTIYIQRIGKVEEFIEPLDAEIVFQNLPGTIELGKKIEFKFTAQTQRARRMIGLESSSMDIKLLYGKTNQRARIQPLKHSDGSWSVRFTPTCGGFHTVQISLRGIQSATNQFECRTNVIGIPAVGARVRRGPDWGQSSEDGGEGQGGRVQSNDYSPDEPLYVIWDNGNGYSYSWGNSGRYQVELML